MLKASVVFCSCFGIGFIPRGQATAGAIIGGLLHYFLLSKCTPGVRISTVGVIFVLGVYASNIVCMMSDQKDPRFIIVDEIVGVWVALFFVPTSPLLVLLCILLFRLFDKFKWAGIRRVENLNGGWGVMFDDVLAGIYSGSILLLIVGVYGHITKA